MFWAKFSKKLENKKKKIRKKREKKCIFLPESMSDIFSENTRFGLCIVFFTVQK